MTPCPTCAALAAGVERLRAALMDVTCDFSINRDYSGDGESLAFMAHDCGWHDVTNNPATIETVRKLREGK